jgi:hypothetical protein
MSDMVYIYLYQEENKEIITQEVFKTFDGAFAFFLKEHDLKIDENGKILINHDWLLGTLDTDEDMVVSKAFLVRYLTLQNRQVKIINTQLHE